MIYSPDEFEKYDLTELVGSDNTLLDKLDKQKEMNTKFDFIYSNRFWALIIGAVSVYLQSKGIIGQAEMVLIATITSGFIVVKTVDRNTGDAVKATGSTTTVTMPSNVSKVSASTEK